MFLWLTFLACCYGVAKVFSYFLGGVLVCL